jgi:hypothetical protein
MGRTRIQIMTCPCKRKKRAFCLFRSVLVGVLCLLMHSQASAQCGKYTDLRVLTGCVANILVSTSIGSHVLPYVKFCLRSGQAAIEALNQPVNKSAQEPRCWSVRCLSIRLPAGWLAGLLVCSSARLLFCSWRIVVVGSQLTAVQATTGDAVADDTASSGDSSTAAW